METSLDYGLIPIMNHAKSIADQVKVKPAQVSATIELLDSENTIPFIARYRKEVTNGLDEKQIRDIRDLLVKLRALEERRETVLNSIQGQDKLTPDLKAQILAAQTRTELEDLYQPFKPKRKTRAIVARARGLQPLADRILMGAHDNQTKDQLAAPYLNEAVATTEDAWAGARDIVAETISDHPGVRRITREKALRWSRIHVSKIDTTEDSRGVYQDYYQFQLPVEHLRPHQVLAINRGEKEKVLKVNIDIPDKDWQFAVNAYFPSENESTLQDELELAIEDAAKRLLLPAIERDIRRSLTETAEVHAIQVFATNLRNLLKQPPFRDHWIMGIDPGFRTGCKVAAIDPTGKPMDTATIYPHAPQKEWDESKKTIKQLTTRYPITLIAIGNGTASRETEQLVAEFISAFSGHELHYLIVNEAGASVYSASSLGREELPEMDVSIRGAVSIARRVQDPLAELVKIDPKSIGVGLYQHDVNQKELSQTLDSVVESVVNQVGVDLNTASAALLAKVAGLGPTLAMRIVEHRNEHGPFPKRHSLLDIPGLGPKTFQQAAGFLRIQGSENPLDASAIHPESYPVAEKILRATDINMQTPAQERERALNDLRSRFSIEKLAQRWNVGVPTLEDIYEQLARPGRDPRKDLPTPILRSEVLSMQDLSIGMRLNGTVRNVVDFGAFIDIGVKQDGLLHRSQIPRQASLQVGDVIEVNILKVEIERGRISLGWAEN